MCNEYHSNQFLDLLDSSQIVLYAIFIMTKYFDKKVFVKVLSFFFFSTCRK